MEEWMEETVISFLKVNGDLGTQHRDAVEFVDRHKKFVDTIVVRSMFLLFMPHLFRIETPQ